MSQRIGLQTISPSRLHYQPERQLREVCFGVFSSRAFTGLTVVTDINEFHSWQTASFGANGAKGVHIGPHATLYTDTLLADMGLRSGHLDISIWRPIDLLREWFRPMYPEIYSRVEAHRRNRFKAAISSTQGADYLAPRQPRGDGASLRDQFLYFVLTCILFCLMMQFF